MEKMTIRISWILILAAWIAIPCMAQHRGHTGGLGEARIYFNVSSAENLAKAPGMDLELADAVVEYREDVAPFVNPEDLLKVPGITKEIYEQIDPQKGTEGELYTVPREGEELEDDDIPLSPSKC
ncbi:MAG: helix-hairpin-helix domain-containing protein [Acidobacteriota bacterium]